MAFLKGHWPLLAIGVASFSLASCAEKEARGKEVLLQDEVPGISWDVGSSWERQIEGGEVHAYPLDLAAGEYLEVVVEQQGVDVAVAFVNPSGKRLFEVDSPNDDRGPEPVLALVATSGRYRLEVRAGQGSGRYEVRVVALRQATEEDRRRAEAAGRFREGEELRRARSFEEAARSYEKALSMWHGLDERAWMAETYDRLGRVHSQLGRWRQAIDFHQRAGAVFQQDHEIRQQAVTLDLTGQAYMRLGETERALERFERALALWREAEDRKGEAITWNNLGLTYRRLGEIQKALDAYGRALAGWKEFGPLRSEASTLHNLGLLHFHLGREDRALDYLTEAEALWSRLGEIRGRAATLNLLGELFEQRDELDEALNYFERALSLRREAADRRGLAWTLANIALVHMRRSDYKRSLELYGEAGEIFGELQESLGQARVLFNVGGIHNLCGQPREALEALGQALEILRRIREPAGEADTLVEMAAAERRLGDLDAAQARLESALGIYESLRLKALSQELRSSYFATIQSQYGDYVDLLMEQDRREAGAGHAAAALAASERKRARSLLELLRQAGAAARPDADPRLLERERQVQEDLNALERLRTRRLDDDPWSAEQLATFDKKLRALTEKLAEVRARIHAGGPHLPAPIRVEPLGPRSIQKQVLDEETLLLELELGKERSFLWILGPEKLDSFELPPRDEIERAAQVVYDSLIRSRWRESEVRTRASLCALGRMLLGDAAESLTAGRRLVIVAAGALQYIPFGALPDPREPDCSVAPPLMTRFEIVHAPSASILAALRQHAFGRAQPAGEVAVLADSVYSASDPRVADHHGQASHGPHTPSFSRLEGSAQEAKAILAVADERRSLVALGFEASKPLATSGALSGYRVLHFATHGVINAKAPELSSLVLSTVDEEGRPRDGMLHAHEIINLELNADLAVLSACETGLGKDVRGEGLVGFLRSFFIAGVPRVIVSLWNVDDRATAELMARFYRGIFDEDLRPAAALGRAQLSLWKDPRWHAPYYWAGFVLQGEWR